MSFLFSKFKNNKLFFFQKFFIFIFLFFFCFFVFSFLNTEKTFANHLCQLNTDGGIFGCNEDHSSDDPEELASKGNSLTMVGVTKAPSTSALDDAGCSPSSLFSNGFVGTILSCAAKLITVMLHWVAFKFISMIGWFLEWVLLFVAYFVDIILYYTVVKYKDNFVSAITSVNLNGQTQDYIYVMWAFIRDILNTMVFFIMMYHAIRSMIEGFTEIRNKFIYLLVFALLVNFSLLFVKAVIDISNIVTLTIYQSAVPNIKNQELGSANTYWQQGIPSTIISDSEQAKTFAGYVIKALNPHQKYKDSTGKALSDGEIKAKENEAKAMDTIAFQLGYALAIAYLIYIFLVIGSIFLVRAGAFVAAMILSPLIVAKFFYSDSSSKLGSTAERVKYTLLDYSLRGPIYLFIVLLSATFARAMFGNNPTGTILPKQGFLFNPDLIKNFIDTSMFALKEIFMTPIAYAQVGAATAEALQNGLVVKESTMFIRFLVFIGLFHALKQLADSFIDELSKGKAFGGKWAKWMAGKAFAGGAGFVGKQTIGRLGNRLYTGNFGKAVRDMWTQAKDEEGKYIYDSKGRPVWKRKGLFFSEQGSTGFIGNTIRGLWAIGALGSKTAATSSFDMRGRSGYFGSLVKGVLGEDIGKPVEGGFSDWKKKKEESGVLNWKKRREKFIETAKQAGSQIKQEVTDKDLQALHIDIKHIDDTKFAVGAEKDKFKGIIASLTQTQKEEMIDFVKGVTKSIKGLTEDQMKTIKDNREVLEDLASKGKKEAEENRKKRKELIEKVISGREKEVKEAKEATEETLNKLFSEGKGPTFLAENALINPIELSRRVQRRLYGIKTKTSKKGRVGKIEIETQRSFNKGIKEAAKVTINKLSYIKDSYEKSADLFSMLKDFGVVLPPDLEKIKKEITAEIIRSVKDPKYSPDDFAKVRDKFEQGTNRIMDYVTEISFDEKTSLTGEQQRKLRESSSKLRSSTLKITEVLGAKPTTSSGDKKEVSTAAKPESKPADPKK